MADTASVPVTAPAAPAPASAPAEVTIHQHPGQATKRGSLGGTVEFHRDPSTPSPATPAPAGDARPGWLPEKFKSPEDLARAYGELEKRLGGAPPASEPAVAPASGVGDPVEAPASPAAAPALVARMTQEFAASGAVSPELRAEFKRTTGLDERFIDQQISYLKAQGTRASELAVTRLGGEQAVRELMEWAGKRLPESDRAAFNRAVYSGDEAMARFAVDGLAAKYEMEVGRSPKVMAGRKPQEQYAGIQPFQSNEEWSRARKDPRYKQDPAYRQEVEDRLRVAVNLGLIPA